MYGQRDDLPMGYVLFYVVQNGPPLFNTRQPMIVYGHMLSATTRRGGMGFLQSTGGRDIFYARQTGGLYFFMQFEEAVHIAPGPHVIVII